MSYRKELFDRYVTTHTERLYDHERGVSVLNPYFKSYFARFLPEDKNTPILDVGCGSGEFLLFLQSLGYTNTFGIDLSPEQVELAKKRGLKNVQVAEAVDFLSKHKEKFTLITAHDVIEHFPKEQVLPFLDAIYNALVRGGTVILSLPNMASPFGARITYGDFTHEVAFTPTSISQVLRAAGFEVVGVFPKEPVVHGVKSFVRWALWKIIKQFIRFYLLVETGSVYSAGHGVYTQVMYVIGRKQETGGRRQRCRGVGEQVK